MNVRSPILSRAAARFAMAGWLLLAGREATAHSMGVVYNLPIPFWMYAFAASAALALSFLMVGFFVTVQGAERNFRSIEIPASSFSAHSWGATPSS